MNKPQSACTDEEFIELFSKVGGTRTAQTLGIGERSVYARRRRLEKFAQITAPSKRPGKEYPHRAELEIQNGIAVVGSDFHIWPDSNGLMLRAFKKFCKDTKPFAVILNGDVLDFPQISRHSSIMWETTPLPVEEIEAAQDHLNDIVQACGSAHKIWPMGNHDARFESFMANSAPQMKGIKGIHLSDHFALWRKAWSCWINNEVVIKHRWKGGIHATHNNTVGSGKTMITGHLHSQKVTPYTDYNGTRYGVDTGCVADPDHRAFVGYTEDNPLNWRSGFCVLTFKDGKLMAPELVSAWDENHIQFRGQITKV